MINKNIKTTLNVIKRVITSAQTEYNIETSLIQELMTLNNSGLTYIKFVRYLKIAQNLQETHQEMR